MISQRDVNTWYSSDMTKQQLTQDYTVYLANLSDWEVGVSAEWVFEATLLIQKCETVGGFE